MLCFQQCLSQAHFHCFVSVCNRIFVEFCALRYLIVGNSVANMQIDLPLSEFVSSSGPYFAFDSCLKYSNDARALVSSTSKRTTQRQHGVGALRSCVSDYWRSCAADGGHIAQCVIGRNLATNSLADGALQREEHELSHCWNFRHPKCGIAAHSQC